MRVVLLWVFALMNIALMVAMPSTALAERMFIGVKPSCAVIHFVDNTSCREVDSGALLTSFVEDDMVARDVFSIHQVSEDMVYPDEQALKLNNDFRSNLQAEGIKYILTGSVLEVSSGISDDVVGATIGKLIGFNDMSSKNDFVKVRVEMRLVDMADGKSVWREIAEAKDSDSAVSTGDIHIGELNVDQDQYYRALEKCSKKLVGDLCKDIQSRKVHLTAR